MADYSMLFATLGAELKNQRKAEAVFEDFHFVSNSNYAKRLISAQYSDSSVYQEAANSVASRTYEGSVAPSIQSLCSTLKSAFELGWFPVLDSEIATNPVDKSAGAISYGYDGTLNDGTVAIQNRFGRWGALRRKMVADGQVLVKNTLAFGSLTPFGSNVGTLALTLIAGADHTLSGNLKLVCIDDTVEAPKFTLVNELTNKLADPSVQTSPDGLFSIIPADGTVQAGKSFEDGPTGVSIKVDLGAVQTTDPQSVIDIAILPPNIGNPTEADTNKGKIYIKIKRLSAEPVWQASWYRDAAMTDLVTQSWAPHATPSIGMTGPGGTVMTFNLDTVDADIAMPAAGNSVSNIVFDFGVPRLDDQWTISVTNSEDGIFATKLARRYRASLNSASAKPAAALTGALAGAGAGNVNNGTHSYSYSYVVNGVETGASAGSNVVTVADKTVNGKVSLTGITVGPSGTTARKVYRTIAGDTGTRKLLTTISDNVTTTYTDNTADGSLGTAAALTQVDDTLATSVSMT